ncbi:MAG: DNA repair protein RadC [Erysipelotrichaceae bacterium]|nr:DNA repair protein RadC [Erysipelotrichaceae bacterium]
MNIKLLDTLDRPRERLIRNGAQALSDYELIAIMLGSGTKEQDVIELSINLINAYGLEKLLRMNYIELKKIKGIKEAKATKLMACFELARRCIKKENNIITLKDAESVYRYAKSDYMFLREENLMVIYVDIKCKPILKKIYSNHYVGSVEIPCREIIKDGLDVSAYGIFLIHNHPSNDLNPSSADIAATFKIRNVLKEVSIILFDHLIVSDISYYSFDENNILNKI